MISVRRAVDSDIAGLCEVFRRASWSNEGDRPLLTEHPEFLEWSGDPAREGRTIVAVDDGVLVGFVSTLGDGPVIEIEDLFVDPDWMRQGAASLLIESAAAAARAAGHTRLVVDGNAHALAFYRHAGFVGEHEVALDHGSATRMHRDL